MLGLDQILEESILREEHAKAMTDNFDDIDMFIQDRVVDDILDTVIDDSDYDDRTDVVDVKGTMFSIYDAIE